MILLLSFTDVIIGYSNKGEPTQHHSYLINHKYPLMFNHSTILKISVPTRKNLRQGHSLGGDCGHIKAYGLALFPHQREF